MTTFADEILEALPALIAQHKQGPTAKDIADCTGRHVSLSMKTAKQLDADKRALFVRFPNSRAFHLLPLGFLRGKQTPCAWCRTVFTRSPQQKPEKAYCSMRCVKLAFWDDPASRSKGHQAILAAMTPERRSQIAESNREVANRPEIRELFSKRTRADWADPAKKAQRSAAISAAWSGTSPEVEARRAKARERKLAFWADPEKAAKARANMRGRRGASERAKAAQKAMWADPVFRESETAKATIARLKTGLSRGRKDTPERTKTRSEVATRRWDAWRAKTVEKGRCGRVAELYALGLSIPTVAELAGLTRKEADFLYPSDPPTCGCGRPSNHKAACQFRRDNNGEHLRVEYEAGASMTITPCPDWAKVGASEETKKRKAAAKQRGYRAANPARVRAARAAAAAKWRAGNPEAVRAATRRWYLKKRAKLAEQRRLAAEKQMADFIQSLGYEPAEKVG